MTDDRDATTSGSEVPEPDRYYAQHVSPISGTGGVSAALLQDAMNEGARQSWRLVGVVNEPTGSGIILVWDLSGFISG